MSPTEQVLSTSLRVSTNSATLLIGPTGSTKSTQLAHFAEYVKEAHGGVTRVYSTDGGGWPGSVEKLVRFGVMEIWRLRTRGLDLAFETMTRATMGYWPSRIKKLTGESPYNCPLLPPVLLKYQSVCPKCGGASREATTSQSAIGPHACALCKTMIGAGQLVVHKQVAQHPAFAHVRAVAYEGITSMGDWAMEDMGTRQGKGELQGEKTALGGVVRSGEMIFGSTNRAHVGFGQNRQHEWVNNSNGIPNLAVPPVWTALTLETSDEGGLRVVGPRLCGQAKTDQAPAWFGNCLEVGYTKDEKDQRQLHLYLSEFIDGDGRRHLIKNRAEVGRLPVKLSDPPLQEDDKGNITNAEVCGTQANMGLFFRLLDQALSEGVAAGREKYGEPSVVDDSVTDWTMGEGPVSTPVVKAPTVAAKPAQGLTISVVPTAEAKGMLVTGTAPVPAPAGSVAIKPRVAVKRAQPKPQPLAQAEKPIGQQLEESLAQVQGDAAAALNTNMMDHKYDEPLGEADQPLPMDTPSAPVTSPPLTVAPSVGKPGQPKAWASPVRRVPPPPPA